MYSKTRIIILFIIVLLCAGCTINEKSTTESDTKRKSRFTTIRYKNGLELTEYSGNYEELTIPKFVDGKKLVKIGGFYDEYDYFYGPFRGSNCKRIKVPSTIKEIEPDAFLSAYKLERIEVDKNNKKYASVDGVLYSKDKKTLICIPPNYKNKTFIISDGTVSVKSLVYNDIESLIIPKTLKKIDINSYYPAWYYDSTYFSACNLKNIVVDRNNDYFKSENGVLYNKKGTELLIFPENSEIEEFTVPKTVKVIKRFYINFLSNLKKLYVGKNVKKIELESDYDFELTYSYRPTKLTIIGYKDSAIYKWYKEQDESEYLIFRLIWFFEEG